MKSEWREGFEKYSDEGDKLLAAVRQSRDRTSLGLAVRQRRILDDIENESTAREPHHGTSEDA